MNTRTQAPIAAPARASLPLPLRTSLPIPIPLPLRTSLPIPIPLPFRSSLPIPIPLRTSIATLLLPLLLLWTGLGGVAAAPAGALPLISEVLYDADGSDAGGVFVELLGVPGSDLSGLVLEAINGADGSVTDAVALDGVFPADGLLVVADDAGGGTTHVPGADRIVDFDPQNGPDGVVLRQGASVVDALGWGSFGADDVFPGEGAPAPDAPSGTSLARSGGPDTGSNAADFSLGDPTPGSSPVLPVGAPAGGLWMAWVGLSLWLAHPGAR